MKTVNGEETVYTYNALNQLVSDNETSYEYDINGNLIRVIGSAQSALYEYNAENKLIKATVQNGSLVIEESYTYDYEGNRTSKTTHKSNGEFEYTKYLNDNSSLTNVLAEIEVLKIKPCKRNNRQNSDHTKDAAKEGNAEERPDAGCGIKR